MIEMFESMGTRINPRARGVVVSGLFAALIFVVTMLHIPTPNQGYIHVGDTFIYLAASLMPLPYAVPCASIGAALADILSGESYWAVFTVVIKAVLVLFFTSRHEGILCGRNIAAIFLAGVVGVVGYAFAGGILFGNLAAQFALTPIQALQPIASGILYVIVGRQLDKMHLKQRFDFSFKNPPKKQQ
jgi:TIGR04002 family protein